MVIGKIEPEKVNVGTMTSLPAMPATASAPERAAVPLEQVRHSPAPASSRQAASSAVVVGPSTGVPVRRLVAIKSRACWR
jgi:hypothetical protein